MPNKIEVNLLNALKNYLDMYTCAPPEVVVIESIANSLDEKADRLIIRLDGRRSYYELTDNGNGMSKQLFKKYHTVALSTKQKGATIGFAGVGAKIYLAAWSGAEIITETYGSDGPLASRMYRRGDELLFDYIRPKINRRGTRYKVQLAKTDFYTLNKNLTKYVLAWFNHAIKNGVKINYNGRYIPYCRSTIEKSSTGHFNVRKSKFRYEFFLRKDPLPEDRKHLELVVYGKRIRVDKVDWIYLVKEEFRDRIGGVVYVDNLARFMTSNKEDFQKNWYTNKVIGEAKKNFYQWLKESEALISTYVPHSEELLIQNTLTQALDRILIKNEYKWLNPWSLLRTRTVILPGEGNFTGDFENGGQPVTGTYGGPSTGGKVSVSGDENTEGFTRGAGDETASEQKRTARGISIIPIDIPEDPREGWVDPENRAVVYNQGHPFHKKIERSTVLFYYNVARVVISTLIDYGSQRREEPMYATEAMQTLSKVLHECVDAF